MNFFRQFLCHSISKQWHAEPVLVMLCLTVLLLNAARLRMHVFWILIDRSLVQRDVSHTCQPDVDKIHIHQQLGSVGPQAV